MNELNINMLSESELKELLEIRTQITRLQQRYDEIISSGSSSSPSAIAAPAAPHPPAEIKPQPYQTAPVSAVVAPVTPAPTPITARPSTPAGTPSSVQVAFTPSRPVAPRPAPVSSKAVTTSSTAPRPVAVTSAQKAEEAEKIKVDSAVTSNLRQALVQILTTAGKPLPFNTIYSKLQDMGVQLPESKPMLVVRKLLYDKALFDVVKGGLFQIRAEAEIPEDSTETASSVAPQAAAVHFAPVLSAPIQITQLPPPQPAPVFTPTPQQQPKQTSSFNARLDAILNQ